MVYNIHFTFEKVHKKFTVFHKRNITSSQVTTHLKNYLGEQNNRRATEEENGWNPPFYRIPSPTHEEDTFTQKDAGGACATSVDAGGASDPLPQETGTSTTPFPNRPVRATPSPKRMLRAHAQLEWTLGAHQTPFPKRPVRAPPSPLPPPPYPYPYIKG